MVRTSDPALVSAIHRRARNVHEAIDVLTSSGLDHLPDFVLAQVRDDSVTVLVRGTFSVTVETEVDSTTTGGTDAQTWSEIVVPLQAGVKVIVSATHDAGGVTWPIQAGMVLADAVVVARGPVRQPTGEPGPVVTEPEAAPVSSADERVVDVDAAPPAEADAPAPAPPPSTDPDATVFDAEEERFAAMFGHTVRGRRPEDAAVREPISDEPDSAAQVQSPPEAVAAPTDAQGPPFDPDETVSWSEPLADGDHDGRTMTPEEFARYKDQLRVAPATSHRLKPDATLELSTGERIRIESTVVLGRRPQARHASSADVPYLVTIDNPYVSSTHLEIGFDGTQLQATDVSRNGTLIASPGETARAMVPGQVTPLDDGCILELTEGLTAKVSIGGGR